MKKACFILLIFCGIYAQGQFYQMYPAASSANPCGSGFWLDNALTADPCEENDGDGFSDESGGDIAISTVADPDGASVYSVRLTMTASTGASEVVRLAVDGLNPANTYRFDFRAKRNESGTNWRIRVEIADGWDAADTGALITLSTYAVYDVQGSPSGAGTAYIDIITTTFNTSGNTLDISSLTITQI